MKQLGFQQADFNEILYLNIFLNLSKKLLSLKVDENIGYFT